MKLDFAAPARGLPSWLTAFVAQVSAIHFFMNEVLAAPASGLPSLPTALVSQVSCARAALPANAMTKATSIIFLIMVLLLRMVRVIEFDPRLSLAQAISTLRVRAAPPKGASHHC